jgi:hypothetical protein
MGMELLLNEFESNPPLASREIVTTKASAANDAAPA